MNIAVLGWGSLICDKRDLPVVGEWQHGGPVLAIEYSRISSDGRLTLVIDEQNGADVTTQYVRSACADLKDAIASLRKRESNPPTERIGFTEKRGEPYSPEAAIRYFDGLVAKTKARAVEYIERAPPEVDTPFRRIARAAVSPQ